MTVKSSITDLSLFSTLAKLLKLADGELFIIDQQWHNITSHTFEKNETVQTDLKLQDYIISQLQNQVPLIEENMDRRIPVQVKDGTGSITHRDCMISQMPDDPASYLVALLSQSDSTSEEYRRGIVAVSNHELRTPLMIISMGAQMLASKFQSSEDDPQIQQFTKMINDGVSRLTSTFEKLLEYGELLTPYPIEEMIELDFKQLIQACIDEQTTASNHVKWHVRLPDEQITIMGDAKALAQAIRAILENSTTFSNPEQQIGVIVYVDPIVRQCFVKISDEGMGMEAEQLESIFEPFYHGEKILYKHTPGLGLGLTIAKKIFALHSGRIYVDSKADSGTSVTIKLPIVIH